MNPFSHWWNWLAKPHPAAPTQEKIVKLVVRVLLFVLLATLVSAALHPTPLGPYLQTWWGSMLLVLALYIPLGRFMSLDNPWEPTRAAHPATASDTGQAHKLISRTKISAAPAPSALERKRAKKKFAGTSKRPPQMGHRR